MYSRFLIFFIVAGLLHVSCKAQYENVWVFGVGAGLDFNTLPPQSIATNIAGFGEASASVCDENGRLLFYTEGNRIWDSNNKVMPNGSYLVPFFTLTATSSSSQGAHIMPIPGHPKKYYVFSLTAAELGTDKGRLYYSIVDMDLNDGMGDVEPSAKGILLDTNLTEQMTSVPGEDCNIWLLVVSQQDSLKAFSVTHDGISPTPVLSALVPSPGNRIVGHLELSPDRKKLALGYYWTGMLGLYDFNTQNGKADNPIIYDSLSPYGLCFSPDNSKLYIFQPRDRILQLDLNTGSFFTLTGQTLGGMKRARDGKIYVNNSGRHTMDIIHYPNLAGPACRMEPSGITLSGICRDNLPTVVSRLEVKTDTVYQSQHLELCFQENYLLKVESTGTHFLWDDSSANASRTITKSGVYWVQYLSTPCLLRTDTFEVHITPLPKITVLAACGKESNGSAFAGMPPGDTSVYSFIWRNSAGDTLSVNDTLSRVAVGTYTIHIATVQCDTLISFVIPSEEHQVSFHTASVLCQGAQLSVTNTSDPHFTQFYWSWGDGSSSTMFEPMPHEYPVAGTYHLSLAGIGALCTDSFHAIVTVDSLIPAYFRKEPDKICNGETISFFPEADSTTIALLWEWGDGIETFSDGDPIHHAYADDGYKIVHLNHITRACPETVYTDTVFIAPFPIVNLGQDSALCLQHLPIILGNQFDQPQDIDHHYWNTGDTTASIVIMHPGVYSLTLRNKEGCSSMESITISKGCYLDIPNAFTPNGDGINDYFFPRKLLAKNISSFRMQVFNRWGQIIFETNHNGGKGWDGKLNGENQPGGTYIYIIDVEMQNGVAEQYKGNLTLIR